MQNGADLWQAAGFLGMTVELLQAPSMGIIIPTSSVTRRRQRRLTGTEMGQKPREQNATNVDRT